MEVIYSSPTHITLPNQDGQLHPLHILQHAQKKPILHMRRAIFHTRIKPNNNDALLDICEEVQFLFDLKLVVPCLLRRYGLYDTRGYHSR